MFSKNITYKAQGEIVTSVDTPVHEILCTAILREGLSELQILSEEAPPPEIMRGSATWIIDPIGGTREFAASNPEFAVSIACLEANRLVATAILNPAAPKCVLGSRAAGLVASGGERLSSYGLSSVLVSRNEKSHRRWSLPD